MAKYSISAVRPGAKPGDHIVTITKDSKPQGEVVIRTTSTPI
jgi:DNA-directed RNA polymerase subunit H (RpoH/RPB5)